MRKLLRAPIQVDHTRGPGLVSRAKRLGTFLVMAVLSVAATVVGTAAPAHAATYFYKPGHPMYFGGARAYPACTGGYAIRGSDGLFFLTSPSCGYIGSTVYGTDASFGTEVSANYITETALIRPGSGVDAYQIVVDPKTGKSPGKVVGIYPESSLGYDVLVGAMGLATGWTEGAIYDVRVDPYGGPTVYCAYVAGMGSDAGGPVWRSDGAGNVWAVGMITEPYSGCFVAIQPILDSWGAWLPTF